MAEPNPKVPDSTAKIGHAVTLLTSLIPEFGARYSAPDELGRERVGERVDFYVPMDVQSSITRACVAAADFLAREFALRD